MQAPWKRAASIALAASCVAAAMTGCKRPSEQADVSVRQQLAAAGEQLASVSGEPATAVSFYQKAAATPGASDVAKAEAQAGLANAHVVTADQLILQSENKQVQIAQLASLIDQQAERMAANNTLLAGLKKLDPQPVLDGLAKQTAAAQGGADGAPWIAGDASPVPSAAGVKQKVTALKDQIDKLTTQKNDLQTQRALAAQQAEQLRNQSDAASGKQSVDLFSQSSALVKKAADLAVQSDALDAQIVAAQQDLAVAQAQQKQLDAALAALSKQSEQIKQGWSDIQKMIEQSAGLSQALLTSGSAPDAAAAPTTGPSSDASIATAAAAMDKLKTEDNAIRAEAEQHLNDAMGALKTGAAGDGAIARSYLAWSNDPKYRDLAQREAWQGLIDVHNASDPKVQMALVDLRLARLYADWATSVAQRAQSAKMASAALTGAGLTVPESLASGSLGDEVDQAHKHAEAAFTDADALLMDVLSSAASGPLAKSAKDAAQAVQVVELYAHYAVARALGDPKAGDLLTQSKQARDAAVSANVALPLLPTEIALAIVAPPATSGPASAPASTPSTPAPGAAATPAPVPAAPGAPAAGGTFTPAAPAPGDTTTPPAAAPPAAPPPSTPPATTPPAATTPPDAGAAPAPTPSAPTPPQ